MTNAQSRYALTNARVLDGLGGVHDGWTLLVADGRITAAGTGIEVPTGLTTIDLAGCTLLPGLVDMHGHLYARADVDIKGQFAAYPLLYLAGGVTTVRDPGELNPEQTEELKAQVEAGQAIGPRVFTAGPYFDHAPSFVRWIKGTETPDEALTMFEQWRGRIDMVKVYSRIHEDQFVALERAAHAAGLPIIGHLGSLTAQRAIDLGINGLEHGIFTMSEFATDNAAGYRVLAEIDLQSPQVTKLIDSIVRRQVVICPTTITFQCIIDPAYRPAVDDWLPYLSESAQTNQRAVRAKRQTPSADDLSLAQRVLDKQYQFVGLIHAAGGTVVAGTDPTHPLMMPGWGMHRELENLVLSGFTPLEAIRAATYESARVLGVADDRGSIAAGKLADLLVVDGDPSRDISNIGRTRLVIQGGVMHQPAELRRQALGKID